MVQSSEEQKFWQDRWANLDTPWDLRGPHPLTERLLELLKSHCRHIFHANSKAYLPACGSAHDSLPLSKADFAVTAEDLVPAAVTAAQNLYKSLGVECRVGDSLKTAAHDRGAFDLVFDRAALCAMQPHLRQRFWDECMNKLKPGGVFASILFTRMKPEFEGIQGPPFIIGVDALTSLFTGQQALLAAEEHLCANLAGKISHETLVLAINGKRIV